MSEVKARRLVIKRHPHLKGRVILCDEETGHPLDGQTSVVLKSSGDDFAEVTVTFNAFGPYGVRFEDDPRPEH